MNRLFYFFLIAITCMSQFVSYGQQPAWDNTAAKRWGPAFTKVAIPASIDGNIQHAWFYASTAKNLQPLIVSLHTWSGDYNQEDPLAKEALLRNWNYIHPDFRGPNKNPGACGSDKVISDIRDAILYATAHANVDTNNVHVIGVSGGGYAAMMAYLKLEYPVKSFHCWAGISDLENWYWESVGRHSPYAEDLKMVSGKKDIPDFEELARRSPMHVPVKPVSSNTASIHLYAGIHDGYTGSVPISHSIGFYNRLARKLFPAHGELPVPDTLALSMITKRILPHPTTDRSIGNRKIYYQNGNEQLSLTIFEGTHEMLVAPALALAIHEEKQLQPLHILTIGDSNGAFDFGWPVQLQKYFPYARIINKSIAGNTIGFDNLDHKELNTLRNIERYIDETYAELGKENLDIICIGLGTNDAKRIFDTRQKEVAGNLSTLIRMIRKQVEAKHKKVPPICLLVPPPVEEGKADAEKYGGADQRINKYEKSFSLVSKKEKTGIINLHALLEQDKKNITSDGVHLLEPVQFIVAGQLAAYIIQNTR